MPTSAIDKLQPSRLASSEQLELLGGDVDLYDFHMQMQKGTGIDVVSAITDAVLDRTIDGASTLTVSVDDTDDRKIQTSGDLGRRVDVNLDGLWWTLAAVKKAGRKIDLVFEEREVSLLRRYNKPKFADRSKITRAQFVLQMIKEVREVHLKWVIPELKIKQEISDTSSHDMLVGPDGKPLSGYSYDSGTSKKERHQGIHTKTKLYVRGVRATPEQIKNASIILNVGSDMKVKPKLKICSIMTAIAESNIRNLSAAQSDPGSRGVFQQRKDSGWPASGDVATDAKAFFRSAIVLNRDNPDVSYGTLCQMVQHSAYPHGYDPYVNEAGAFVEAFDGSPNAAQQASDQSAAQANSKANMYVRGTLKAAPGMRGAFVLQPENSWNCMQRLASEVNWRAFVVSGTVYFISEQWLFKSKPFMVISEDTPGIDWIDYDYDEGKPKTTCEVTAHMSRWSCPPGSAIQIEDMGPINGKWLVQSVSRSLYNAKGTIILEKPLPKLPEPVALGSIPSGFSGVPASGGNNDYGTSLKDGNKTQKLVVSFAQSQLGVPYVWGAEQVGIAFDCSGLTQAAYNTAGISIPRVAQSQYDVGRKLSKAEIMLPGDLVFFGSSTRNIEHVGIFIGGGKMIDAPHSGARVRVDKNFMNWDNPKFVGASRPWQKGR
jgi:NlpC/P60 family